jgi:hypothetical protein
VLAWSAAERGAAQPLLPRLAVVLVVDQMRADYVDRFASDWTGGLKRLITDGAWFTNAAFPYLTTVTCPGHATIATGTFPRVHGVFQNAWYDRSSQRVEACTADASVTGFRYPEGTVDGASGARLLVPTLADQLRTTRPGARVATVALKARSAIMLAGHGGDAVTWLAESNTHWETSSAFSPAPVPVVRQFLDANSIAADFGRVWQPLLPRPRYEFVDEGVGEAPPRGWTAAFPHPLTGNGISSDAQFLNQWTRSPFADAYVGRFAAALVDGLQLGADDTTDFLGVSFSTPDLVGHLFGPRSHEIQDVYARLDRTIGALLDHLDRRVGRDRYVVALASDHGVSRLPEDLRQEGLDAGRVNTTRLTEALERAAQALAGPGPHIARVNGNDVYLRPGAFAALRAKPGALDAFLETVEDQPGIARAFRGDRLVDAHTSGDPLVRAAALSYVPRRSGDIVYALKDGWIFAATGTTHATANPHDQRVPLVLMGPGIRRGRYSQPATPADVAPTLGALLRVTLDRAEGRPLHEALIGR